MSRQQFLSPIPQMETPGKLKYIWLRNRKKSFPHRHFGSPDPSGKLTDRSCEARTLQVSSESPELAVGLEGVGPIPLTHLIYHSGKPQPRLWVRPLALSRESWAVGVSESCSEHLQAYLAPCSRTLDLMLPYWKKETAGSWRRPAETQGDWAHCLSQSWCWLVRACTHLKLREWQWRIFFPGFALGKRISVPERTTARTKLYPAAAAGFCLAAPSPNNK